MSRYQEEWTLEEKTMFVIGNISPVGETNEDNRRFENLKALCELTGTLMYNISEVAAESERPEFSVSRAGKYAKEFLDTSCQSDTSALKEEIEKYREALKKIATYNRNGLLISDAYEVIKHMAKITLKDTPINSL